MVRGGGRARFGRVRLSVVAAASTVGTAAACSSSSDEAAGSDGGSECTIIEGVIYRFRTGIPWRDLPRERSGPWQTVWKRHYLYARLGMWDRIHSELMAEADARGDIDWTVSVDATITRAHQHGTNTTRPDQHTGGRCEPQESGRGRA